jgi:hypothetical protein
VPLLLLLCACPLEPNFEFTLSYVDKLDDCSSPRGLPVGDKLVRITFLKRQEGDVKPSQLRKYRSVCEAEFLPHTTPSLAQVYIPRLGEDPHYTVRIDVFSDKAKPTAGTLAYSGQFENVDLSRHGLQPYVLRPPGFSCTYQPNRYRAFHSATLLPNGQVLLFGGVAADPTAFATNLREPKDDRAYATDKAEVYDPVERTFQELRISSSLGHTIQPRAFHQAFLLPSPPAGPYYVALVGGIAPKQGCTDCRAVRVGFSSLNLPFLFTPHEDSVPVEVGLLKYQPPQDPKKGPWSADYVKVTDDGSGKPLPAMGVFFPGGAGEDLLALGGGPSKYVASTPSGWFEGDVPMMLVPDPKIVDPASAKLQMPTNAIPLNRRRAGHAVARMSASTFLVVGGTMTGVNTDPGDVAELVALGNASAFSIPNPAGLKPTAWHTLTRIATDAEVAGVTAPQKQRALWASGYTLRYDAAFTNTRAADALTSQTTMLELTGTDLSAATVGAGKWVAVGYHEATPLFDGSVLLTGGNAENGRCMGNVICPQTQMATYAATGGDLVEQQRLSLPRFGHRVTRLLDNTLLITGGVTSRFKCKNPADSPDVTSTGLACRRTSSDCSACETGYACNEGKCACTDLGVCGLASAEALLAKQAEIFNPRRGDDNTERVLDAKPPRCKGLDEP